MKSIRLPESHSNEPDQLVVLDPRLIKVIEQGETKAKSFAKSQELEGYQYAITAILKAIRGEVGGELTWDKKIPSLAFKIGWASFELRSSDKPNNVYINIDYQYGRAKGGMSISYEMLRNESIDQIVQGFLQKARRIAARKTDLSFTPIMSLQETKVFITDDIAAGQSLEFNETIHNDDKLKYCSINVSGKFLSNTDGITINNRVYLSLYTEKFNVAFTTKINDRPIVSTSGYGDEFSNAHTAIGMSAMKYAEALRSHFKHISPDNTYRKSWEKWQNVEQFEAYKGWLVENCGIWLGGRLVKMHFSAEVAAYHAYADKKGLINEIKYRTQYF